MALLKFFTKNCEPCKLLSNILEKAEIKVKDVDARHDLTLVSAHNIRTVPTLVHEETGEKLVGLKSIIEIQKWIAECDQKMK